MIMVAVVTMFAPELLRKSQRKSFFNAMFDCYLVIVVVVSMKNAVTVSAAAAKTLNECDCYAATATLVQQTS